MTGKFDSIRHFTPEESFAAQEEVFHNEIFTQALKTLNMGMTAEGLLRDRHTFGSHYIFQHKEAIDILKKADRKWEFEPDYGEDLAKEHEKYITEYFNGPVFVKNWPKDIKSYYMKLNPDGKTVAAVDLEVPGAGEIMGGSQREEDYEKLVKRMKEMNIDTDQLYWYLDLRRYGSNVHSGFGLGFERLLMYITGMENIRDVIPFPRTPNNCDF